MAERHRLALFIVDPGACNPSGIAHTLIKACAEAREDGIAPTKDAAVRLIVTQLAWICSADSDTADYGALLQECRQKADVDAAAPATPHTQGGQTCS